MIPLTQRKLREAEFFLRHLDEERRKLARNEPDAFRFYLNAFLSAASGVRATLMKEEKARYDAWAQGWWASRSHDDDGLKKFMQEERNADQHEGGTSMRDDWEYVSAFEFYRQFAGNHSHGEQLIFFEVPGDPPPHIARPAHRFEISGTEEEVTAACWRYLGLMRALVTDFLKAQTEA